MPIPKVASSLCKHLAHLSLCKACFPHFENSFFVLWLLSSPSLKKKWTGDLDFYSSKVSRIN